MKPSDALQLHRDAIRRVVERNDACNPRIFGSVLHGDDTDDSDIDTPLSLHERFREVVLREAIPV